MFRTQTAFANDIAIPANCIRLNPKQEVRIKGSLPHYDIRVGVTDDASEAWTTRAAGVLDDAPADVKRIRMEERRTAFENAVALKTGDMVWIEGTVYRVRVLGAQYADPIAFIKEA
ncbi:hypothetical protein [Caudoviricetes sp.]|nr:hypothetical protein [Caudoviricetes sp.]